MNRLRFQRRSLCRLVLACLLAGTGLIFHLGCSKSKAEKVNPPVDLSIAVTAYRATLRSMDRTIPVTGTLFAKDEATLSAEVEGRVEKTLVEFGDQVKAGQELALIDTKSYEAMANQAAANVTKARATADNMEKDLKRVDALG